MYGHISAYATIIKETEFQVLPVEIIELIVDYATPIYKSSSPFTNVSLLFREMVMKTKRNIYTYCITDRVVYPKRTYDTIVIYSSKPESANYCCQQSHFENALRSISCRCLIIECNYPIRDMFHLLTWNSRSFSEQLVIVTDALSRVAKAKRRDNIIKIKNHQYMGSYAKRHQHSYILTFNRNQIPESVHSSNEFYRTVYDQSNTK